MRDLRAEIQEDLSFDDDDYDNDNELKFHHDYDADEDVWESMSEEFESHRRRRKLRDLRAEIQRTVEEDLSFDYDDNEFKFHHHDDADDDKLESCHKVTNTSSKEDSSNVDNDNFCYESRHGLRVEFSSNDNDNSCHESGLRAVSDEEVSIDDNCFGLLHDHVLNKGILWGERLDWIFFFDALGYVFNGFWSFLELFVVAIEVVLSILVVVMLKQDIFLYIHHALILAAVIFTILDVFSLARSYPCKKKSKKKSKFKCFTSAMNFARIYVADSIVYPLLICDILEFIIGRGFELNSNTDILSLSLFAYSCFAFVFVFITRETGIFIGMIKIYKKRDPVDNDLDEKLWDSSRFHYRVRAKGLRFQMFIEIHAILQFLSQLLMVAAIGGKILYDNRQIANTTDEAWNKDVTSELENQNTSNITHGDINISGYLWYVMVAGYVVPKYGNLIFYLVLSNSWHLDHIGLILNVAQRSKAKPDAYDDINDINKIITDYASAYDMKELYKHFKYFYDKDSYSIYSNLKSSVSVNWGIVPILCAMHVAMHLGFMVCAAITIDEEGSITSQILNGGKWTILYIVMVIFNVIVNIHSFVITFIAIVVLIAYLASIPLSFIAAAAIRNK